MLSVRRLGLVEYSTALAIQQDLVNERRAGTIGDTLLLLEHRARHHARRPKSSSGRRTWSPPPEELRRQGISVVETGRGGDVTYHGPGQLVGYPILDLKPDRCDVHRYVRDLEEALIVAIGTFGVSAGRVAGRSGVWVGPAGTRGKARGHWHSHQPLDHLARVRAQRRDHDAPSLRLDRALRHRRPRRDVSRAGAEPAVEDVGRRGCGDRGDESGVRLSGDVATS